MREIKFRGRQIDSGAWCFGSLHQHYDGTYIYPLPGSPDDLGSVDNYHVDPETVGQFTGLKDKNGKDIYEGDVLKAYRREDTQKKQPITSEVTFLNGCYMAFNCTYHELYRIWQSDLEVIGNIYENPANYEIEQLDEQHRKKVFEELRKSDNDWTWPTFKL